MFSLELVPRKGKISLQNKMKMFKSCVVILIKFKKFWKTVASRKSI